MKVFIFILLFCFAANAQSSDELRQKYGAPTSETYTETYQARPYNEKTKLSVGVTVTYTKNKEICQILVDLFPYFVGVDIPTTKEEDELKSQLLREVVNEVLSSGKRGRHIINGFVSGSCSEDGCFGTFERYEKVTIFYNGNNHRYARISFKEVACK